MKFSLNAGAWNSVFAVPSSVVDEYIKLADLNSLKLLLFLLRHGGERFTEQELCGALGIKREGELEDAAVFWEQRGIISVNEGEMTPDKDKSLQDGTDEKKTPESGADSQLRLPDFSELAAQPEKKAASGAKGSLKAVYTPREIRERMKTDPAADFLIHQAEEIFGEPSMNKSDVLSLLDSYQLPAEVAVMLLKYCHKIGKSIKRDIRYIFAVSENWSDEDIRTVDRADQKIAALERLNTTAERIRIAVGFQTLSKENLNLIRKWTEEWGYSEELVLIAHEKTLSYAGKTSFRYIDSIISGWHKAGIHTPEAARADGSPAGGAKRSARQTEKQENSSIDMDDVMEELRRQYQ